MYFANYITYFAKSKDIKIYYTSNKLMLPSMIEKVYNIIYLITYFYPTFIEFLKYDK